MDRKLLDLLVCPTTRQPLALLDKDGLAAVNAAITAGTLRRADGALEPSPLDEALVTRDRRTVYRVDDGIPVLLAEDALATTGLDGFPAA
ncbi:Trm112 family protein [Lysobacter sp. SG-8]|uniref:Trm112 family protein n=1 Tax=Marilutibacter penaei TaxID=2759900 RepID=A0A7W3U329_9GAMM|nr:Trm112 family protein [Lysobacter penaei]MBB1088058.1 Trm112 family protein [Lysobacter penaei]